MDKDDEIRHVASSLFFELLFDNLDLDLGCQESFLDVIPNIIFENHNKILCCILLDDDVKNTIFSFEGNKKIGSDVFPMFFFQIFWDIFSKDVLDATKELFGSRHLLKEVDSTFIVLVPKKSDVATFNEYFPISLCNSIYKIFSKVLALRLQRVLPQTISPQQNCFVCGRKILDSIIMVH